MRFSDVTKQYNEAQWNMIREQCPRPRVAVELGSYCGLWAGQLLEEHPGVGELYCVDRFNNNRTWKLWRAAVAPHREKVTVLPVELEVAEHIWTTTIKEKIDILYVDADHHFKAVLHDLSFWVPWVRMGGLILCHDWQMSGPRGAIGRFFGQENVTIEKFGPRAFCESAWIRKRKEYPPCESP